MCMNKKKVIRGKKTGILVEAFPKVVLSFFILCF
jgi:hypothetical protein